MPLTITSSFVHSNKAIHIDAPNGVDFIDPNNPGNVHHFNQGDVINANTRIDFNNNGGYQNVAFVPVPLGGGAVNMIVQNFSAQNINILNGVNMDHNGDLFVFSPNTVLSGFVGFDFGIIFDHNGDMHIDEQIPVPMVVLGGGGIGQP